MVAGRVRLWPRRPHGGERGRAANWDERQQGSIGVHSPGTTELGFGL